MDRACLPLLCMPMHTSRSTRMCALAKVLKPSMYKKNQRVVEHVTIQHDKWNAKWGC
jgi:hypothetical protein